MSKYIATFKRILFDDYQIPDISRNKDDVEIDPNVDDSAFNVDPMDANVGFKENNIQHDVDTLKTILSDINDVTDNMKRINDAIVNLNRTFSDIGKSSKTIANINQKLHDLNGELEGYIISLPATATKDVDSNKNEV